MERRGDRCQLAAGRHAVVIVVAVGDQNGIKVRHRGCLDREIDQHRHVEVAEQRVDHDRGPARVQQESGHPEPPQLGLLVLLESLRAERLGVRSTGLTGRHDRTLGNGRI
jgi:hypothetical protein